MLANIAVSTFTDDPSGLFTYEIPEAVASRVQIGSAVLVPFGNRKLRGIVWELNVPAPVKGKTRAITSLLPEPPVLSSHQIRLAEWLRDTYASSLFRAIRTINPFAWTPPRAPKTVAHYHLSQSATATKFEALGKRQQALLALLQELPELDHQTLTKTYAFGSSTIKSLLEKGLIHAEQRLSAAARVVPTTAVNEPLTPSSDQKRAIDIISDSLGNARQFLLLGVTNSGKTEVYLQLMTKVLARGEQALLLVPEIALTPQTIARVAGRFPDQVAVWHSQLGQAERRDTYEQITSGQIPLVVGSRSALFLPFPKLGLICIDECHEISYKQEQHPRYHAVAVADFMSKTLGATLILGSATPAVESVAGAAAGELFQIDLPTPVNALRTPPPTITLVDLRQSFKRGDRHLLSPPLVEGLRENLQRGEQSILFLNRRGRASYVFCRECGHVEVCPNCDLPLVFHQPPGASPYLACHHCEFRAVPPSVCPACHGFAIRYLGGGTQRVMAELKEHFPAARLLRLDADTTTKKGSHQRHYEQMSKHEVDIIVGTQVVAKGWNLPQVSLVGVVLADQSLYFPDFRSGERTFQLLTQVIGRAGRDHLPGRVFVQTYQPQNPYLQFATKGDAKEFYQYELDRRQTYGYPPFTQLIKLEGRFNSTALAKKQSAEQAGKLTTNLPTDGSIQVLGPTPAFIPKQGGEYLYQIVLKGKAPSRMLQWISREWSVDIDPISLL